MTNTMKTTLLSMLGGLLLAAPQLAKGQFTYTTNNGALTVTGWTGSGTTATIPAMTNGLPVVAIGANAFQYKSSLTSVAIPNSVTSIGSYAFSSCSGLTSLTIPNSVTSIGDGAFSSCYGLTSVTIPNSVASIGSYAFNYCPGLTNVTIPNSVTSIGSGAFSDCHRLTSVAIPNSVTSIGISPFSGCYRLTAINVDAMNGSYSSLDGALFNKAQSLLVQYPGGKTGSYTVPNSVTTIGDYAFSACYSLTSVTIPSSVTSIGSGAFNYCSGLTSVTIPNSVTNIGWYVFDFCSGLAAINVDPLNGYYSSLDGVLFNKAQSLLVWYPGGKTGSYTVPNSVTTIAAGTFHVCSSLTSVTIPNSVTTIGDYAFNSCDGLTSVTIPNSVTNIGWQAFSNCSSLISVTVGNSVSNIRGYAFSYSSKLRAVYFLGNMPSVTGSSVFAVCTNVCYYLAGTTGWGATYAGRPAYLFDGKPIVEAQPADQRVEPGNSASFSVAATGISPFSYFWKRNGTPIPGATQSSYTLTNCQLADSGSQFSCLVSNAYGTTLSSNAMLTVVPVVSLCEAVDACGLVWTTGGTAPWTSQSANTHDGIAAARSGVITHSQESWLETTVQGPGTLSFWWSVSAQANYDYLELYINGTVHSRISGTVGWSKVSLQIGNGTQMLRWRYMKDGSASSGSDCGWLDQVTLGPADPLADYVFSTNGASLTITSYTGSGGNVTIPASAYGMPVVALGGNAFYHNTSLTSVTIPSSVASIGSGAFAACYGLTAINVAPLNSTFSSLDGVLFDKAQSILDQYPAGKPGSYTIPNSVTSVWDNAFADCSGLTSVTIPNSVTSIGDGSFSYCTGLTSLTIGSSITSIGDGAFYHCTSLTSVTIPNSVTSIGIYAFCYCSGMTNVVVGSSVASIGSEAFAACYGLTAINVAQLNSTFSSLDGVLFNKAQSLLVQCPAGKTGSYAIPKSVTHIEVGAFYSCTGLASVTTGSNLTSIGDYAFEFCSGLTSMTIGSSVTSIGFGAFYYCTRLASVFFQGNAPSLGGSYVFYDAPTTVYYLPGRTGWGATYGYHPAVLWNPAPQTTGPSFGVGANGFGFGITGTANIPIVVEATTNLTGGAWVPLQTCTITNGSIYFSDPAWKSCPARFYRIRSP